MGWWSLVLCASYDKPEWGYGVAAFLFAGHMYLSKNVKRDISIWIPCFVVGYIGDSLLILNGIFQDPKGMFFPTWLIGLWALFPLTLAYSFKPVLKNRKLTLLAGAAGGFSYYAGNSFGVLTTSDPILINLSINAFVWMFYLSVFRLILKFYKVI
ncbi:MAG: DUF2878 domain-containing protein [Bdellovibrionales bacterium]|nr:DUF2878 domain-containing protein [Bdellovibrionales bacterium]